MIEPLKSVSLVVTPKSGRKRTYTLTPRRVGRMWQFYEGMIAQMETALVDDLKPKKRRG